MTKTKRKTVNKKVNRRKKKKYVKTFFNNLFKSLEEYETKDLSFFDKLKLSIMYRKDVAKTIESDIKENEMKRKSKDIDRRIKEADKKIAMSKRENYDFYLNKKNEIARETVKKDVAYGKKASKLAFGCTIFSSITSIVGFWESFPKDWKLVFIIVLFLYCAFVSNTQIIVNSINNTRIKKKTMKILKSTVKMSNTSNKVIIYSYITMSIISNFVFFKSIIGWNSVINKIIILNFSVFLDMSALNLSRISNDLKSMNYSEEYIQEMTNVLNDGEMTTKIDNDNVLTKLTKNQVVNEVKCANLNDNNVLTITTDCANPCKKVNKKVSTKLAHDKNGISLKQGKNSKKVSTQIDKKLAQKAHDDVLTLATSSVNDKSNNVLTNNSIISTEISSIIMSNLQTVKPNDVLTKRYIYDNFNKYFSRNVKKVIKSDKDISRRTFEKIRDNLIEENICSTVGTKTKFK